MLYINLLESSRYLWGSVAETQDKDLLWDVGIDEVSFQVLPLIALYFICYFKTFGLTISFFILFS